MPDFSKEFIITTDPSITVVGGVLSQEFNGIEQPIAFESHSLNDAQKKYPVHELELLAILRCIKVWRCYVEGSSCVVRTDHASLKYVLSQKNLSRRMARWVEQLQTFDIKIEYRPGRENVVADFLSRADLFILEETDWPSLVPLVISGEPISESNRRYEQRIKNELPKFRYDSEAEQILRLEDKKELLYLPFVVRADTVLKAHLSLGHLGWRSILQVLQDRVWWPGITKDVKEWISKCGVCQQAVGEKVETVGLFPLKTTYPFERWSLDFIGICPETKSKNRWIIVGIDHCTKWPIARAVKEATAESVSKFIYEEIFLPFGSPREILTDRGANFKAQLVEDYLETIKVKHVLTTAFHPRTNGAVERFNRLFGGI